MIIQIIALFCCGTFYGAALYISLAQHPAALEAGVSVGGRFFPPMYKRAAPLQIALALFGFIAGVLAWLNGMGVLWLVGSLMLISVVPITLILIKPINDILLAPENDPESENTQNLLSRWGPKHWLRTIVSGGAFLVYLFAAVGQNN
ncbi:protein of unknown function (DUF1772) [Shewanella psychrophila]|uniref:Integral membrane protein n=1 Tax=Shewanella psychrophila TaxID=225848 RepID=A0A1S6HTQ7_9GAMM|nr:DUF1772 domain-containing protein [Shewanella psychrophila]AQS38947.1 protein of unknown function (DUF1772) [Shewanella psychrophila]